MISFDKTHSSGFVPSFPMYFIVIWRCQRRTCDCCLIERPGRFSSGDFFDFETCLLLTGTIGALLYVNRRRCFCKKKIEDDPFSCMRRWLILTRWYSFVNSCESNIDLLACLPVLMAWSAFSSLGTKLAELSYAKKQVLDIKIDIPPGSLIVSELFSPFFWLVYPDICK